MGSDETEPSEHEESGAERPEPDPPDAARREPGRSDRIPDQNDPQDTDGVIERSNAPGGSGVAPVDPDAPGNYVDDEQSSEVPEPNEPA